jgi:hypothetical protein
MHDANSEMQQEASAVCLFLATTRDRKRVYTHGNTQKDIIAGTLYGLMISQKTIVIWSLVSLNHQIDVSCLLMLSEST